METYISFLRGINMTGHNSIKMIDLRSLFTELGFTDVETYIASGNVIFRNCTDLSMAEISESIEKTIFDSFGYIVPSMIRRIEEIRKLITDNPYISEINFDPSKMAVIFLDSKPSRDQINEVADVSYYPEKFKIMGQEIFIYCPDGFGKSKLYSNIFEKKMKIKGTARNWNTVSTILSIAENRKI